MCACAAEYSGQICDRLIRMQHSHNPNAGLQFLSTIKSGQLFQSCIVNSLASAVKCCCVVVGDGMAIKQEISGSRTAGAAVC